MTPEGGGPVPWRRAWLWLGALGLAARVGLALVSIGSNDTATWLLHGQHVAEGGLIHTYQAWPFFNHPPLMGWWAALAFRLSGGELYGFGLWLKLPGILGEGLSAWLLYRMKGPRLFGLYALCPAAILVSGYHGNTDSLCGALALAAVVLAGDRRPLLAGLLLAAALEVKLLAVVLVPALALAVPRVGPRDSIRFGAGLLLGLLPFAALAVLSPQSLWHNVLGYGSEPSSWGLMALLNAAARTEQLAPLAELMRRALIGCDRVVVLAASVAVAVLGRRRFGTAELVALAGAGSLVLAQGFGVQYLAFLLPLVFAADERAGVRFGLRAGAFLLLVYVTFLSAQPLTSNFVGAVPAGSVPAAWWPLKSDFRSDFATVAVLFGVFAWWSLGRFAWARWRQLVPQRGGVF